MNVTIATFGSRGDIQPLLAPALGLQRAGHRATIVVLQDLERWALAYGVAVHPMKFNVREFMRNPETAAALKGRNILRQLKMVRNAMDSLVAGALDEILQAVRQCAPVSRALSPRSWGTNTPGPAWS